MSGTRLQSLLRVLRTGRGQCRVLIQPIHWPCPTHLAHRVKRLSTTELVGRTFAQDVESHGPISSSAYEDLNPCVQLLKGKLSPLGD